MSQPLAAPAQRADVRAESGPAAAARVDAVARRWPRLIVVLFGLVALIALCQVAWTVAVLSAPGEVEYGESIIHDQAARLLRGEALYQHLNVAPYTVAAYTPVYYVLAAALQAVLGVGFLPGRLLSLAAGAGTVGLVAMWTARVARSRRAALLASVLFFAVGLGGGSAPIGALMQLLRELSSPVLTDTPTPMWAALYKEDALGVFFSVAAMLIVAQRRSWRACAAAGLLAALAVLTKQTFFAASIAGVVWLWQRDRREAVLFAAVDVLVIGVVAAVMQATSGAFVENAVLANANPISIDALTSNLKMLLLFQGTLALAAVVYVLGVGPRVAMRTPLGPLVLYWLATMLPVLGISKVGANYNYWIEFAAPTAVLAGVAIWQLGPAVRERYRGASRAAAALVLANMAVLAVLLCGPLVRTSLLTVFDSRGRTEFAAVVARVEAEPARSLAAPSDVITLAGRPVLFEPYIFSIWYSSGLWDAQPLVDGICRGDVGLLVLDRPIDQPVFEFQGYSSWPAPVIAALRARAVLESEHAGRYVYRLSTPCVSQGP